MQPTKAIPIYWWARDLHAVQLLLEHAKLESSRRYPGVEVDDALKTAEPTGA